MSIICPVCRSVLEPQGHIDFSASALQRVPCPVCTYPVSMASVLTPDNPLDLLTPNKWDGFKIITAYKPVVRWEQVEAQAPALGTNASGAQPEPVLPQSAPEAIGYGLGKTASSIGQIAGQVAGQTASGFFTGLGTAGTLAVFGVLVIFLYMMFRE